MRQQQINALLVIGLISLGGLQAVDHHTHNQGGDYVLKSVYDKMVETMDAKIRWALSSIGHHYHEININGNSYKTKVGALLNDDEDHSKYRDDMRKQGVIHLTKPEDLEKYVTKDDLEGQFKHNHDERYAEKGHDHLVYVTKEKHEYDIEWLMKNYVSKEALDKFIKDNPGQFMLKKDMDKYAITSDMHAYLKDHYVGKKPVRVSEPSYDPTRDYERKVLEWYYTLT